MSDLDPRDGLDELLRSALHEEGDAVMPSGDGLSRIQSRISARRGRGRWLRPAAVVGAAAAVAGASVGAVALTHGSGGPQKVAVTPASQAPSTPPQVPTATPVQQSRPAALPPTAFYPFASAAQEQSWQSGYAATGADSWHTDPAATATHFTTGFVGQPTVSIVVSQTGPSGRRDVTMGAKNPNGDVHPVTVVHLVRYQKAWIVVGADDPQGMLQVDQPSAGDAVSSPVRVSGPGYGVDESIAVDVRSADRSGPLGSVQHPSFGSGTPQWSTSVDFAPGTSPAGAVVLVDIPGSGTVTRIAAVPVRFAGAVSASGDDHYFYGVKNGRVTQFAARDGSSVQYLTSPQAGGGASDPQLVGDRVFYLTGAGTCANELRAVSTGGDGDTGIRSSDDGYTITGYAVASADGVQVALVETACSGGASQIVEWTGTGRHVIATYPSAPPMPVGDPAWLPDRQHLVAFVRTGNSGGLMSFDATSGDSSPACTGFDINTGLPVALDADASSTLWVAVQTGNSMQVVRCTGDTASVAFTIDGQDAPSDVDVTPSGSGVLLTDQAGKVWRWDGSGGAVRLSPSQPLSQVTW